MTDNAPIRLMYAAVSAGETAEVEQLLQREPALLHAQTNLGSWLHLAIRKRQLGVARLLLSKGIDINIVRPTAMDTPLNVASAVGNVDAANFLLDRGANVEGAAAHGGVSPLVDAVASGSAPVVDLLLKHQARIDVKAGNPPVPLVEFAQRLGHSSIAQMLDDPSAESRAPLEREEYSDEVGAVLSECFTGLVLLRKAEVSLVLGSGGEHHRTIVTVGRVPTKVQGEFIELDGYVPLNWYASGSPHSLDEQALLDVVEAVRAEVGERPELLQHPFVVMRFPFVANGFLSRFDSFLLARQSDDFGQQVLRNGTILQMFTLFPLYKEEREFERDHGIRSLLQRFDSRGIGLIINATRDNAILPQQ